MGRILYVEDRHDVREVFERLLRRRGYDIFATPYHELAISNAKDADMLIYGIRDPNVLDGAKLLDEIRAVTGPIPAIATSPFLMPKDIARIQDAGFDCVVREPIFFDQLETTIRACTRVGTNDQVS